MKCTMSRSLWILIASVISKDVLPHFTHFDIAMNHVLSVANEKISRLIRNRFSGARAPARLPVRVRTQTG